MVILNSNNFRTEYHAKLSQQQIDFNSDLLTIGSCFSENIGKKLMEGKFSTLANPFGTVYNPISIFKLLGNAELDASKFVEVGEQYFHLDFHSQFTAKDCQTLETVLTLKMKEVSEYVSRVNCVFVTFGTAHVYESKENKDIVANCHKLPQRDFNKRLLSIEEMVASFDELKSYLIKINSSIQFIFTVSPVRHIKDGIAENQLSKSILRVLCHELAKGENVNYFPAYEMLMDDLRDYRFYKTDMIHPSEMAEDYIWDKFQQTYFSEQTRKIVSGWEKVRTALAHRPFNPETAAHQKFLKEQLVKLDVFSEYFDVEEERNVLQKQFL